MSDASISSTTVSAAARPGPQDLPVPPTADDVAPAVAAGRVMRLVNLLPDTPFEWAIRSTQRPTTPSRSLVPTALVRREKIRIADRTVPGVPVTWIDKPTARRSAIVHLHGGAYVTGESPGHWSWLEELRRRSGVGAAMIHYRMPPRHPFPRALDDAVTVVTELLRTTDISAGRWILSGDSAGGGLALAVAQQLRDRGDDGPAGLLLTSPWTDLTLSDPQIPAQEPRDVILTRDALRRSALLYADGYRLDDPRISPRFGEFHDLPPVHLVGAGDDILLSDARVLQASILDAGGEVDYLEQAGAPHDYPIVIDGASSQWAVRRQIEFVRERLGIDS